MTRDAAARQRPIDVAASELEVIQHGRDVVAAEAQAIADLVARVDHSFYEAVNLLRHCRGALIVTGIGKAGLIGQKLAATLASTGTRSHFLHPAEAIHGDLGRIHRDDVVLVLSQSGETEEVVRLLPSLTELETAIIAITARRTSTLGCAASVVIELGPLKEACALGLAPSTSTTAMLGVGDALALVTSRMPMPAVWKSMVPMTRSDRMVTSSVDGRPRRTAHPAGTPSDDGRPRRPRG